ncbi:MAG: CBS domain-containing protein [Methanophagales archaeon ANME-1-THS]|nr:MAG: CBS domain-containing protein [Methanophagales archaeon ANME-1-THS]
MSMELSKEKRVRDIMTRGVISVSLDTSVSEVARILVEKDVSGVVVTAPDGEAVGVISEIDVIKVFDQNWDTLTAEDIMSSFVRTVDPETSIKKAADIMRDLNIHRLLILSLSPAYGLPVGIVTPRDILSAIVRSQ